MIVKRVKTDKGFMVSIMDEAKTVEIQLSMKEALALAEDVKAEALGIINEASQMEIVPKVLKILIDCEKVTRLFYSHVVSNEDSNLELFNIRAVFTDNSSRTYYHECKFSDDAAVRKIQMEYVNNLPIYVDPTDVYPGMEVDENGKKGYNIKRLADSQNRAYAELMESIKKAKPVTFRDGKMQGYAKIKEA